MKDAWYVAAEARALGDKPLAVKVCGEPIVLFRGEGGRPAALQDRCAHRAVALSRGTLRDSCVVCPYHGWAFDVTGRCVAIPANLPGDPIPGGAAVPAYPMREQDGYLWVWPAGGDPAGDPFSIPHLDERGWAWIRLACRIRNNTLNVIENFIDNPHTGYIHGGLFRSPASHLAHHTVSQVEDGVIVDIEEEAKGDSLLARLLLKPGERVVHQDRYLAPSTVQVAYSFGERRKAIGWQFCTPVSEDETRVFVHVTWTAGWLTPLIGPFARVAGQIILEQDRRILDHQGDQLREFGDRSQVFCSTAADTANLWIAGFMRRLAEGSPPARDHEKRVTFRV